MDPCEDLTDEDIRTAIQNATGPKSALFVPEVIPSVHLLKNLYFILLIKSSISSYLFVIFLFN